MALPRAVARSLNVDRIVTGHLCSSVSTIQGPTQLGVYINNFPAAVAGDPIAPHTIKAGKFCVGHAAIVNSGSLMVYAVNRPVARIGDSADFGGIISGSPTVFAGG